MNVWRIAVVSTTVKCVVGVFKLMDKCGDVCRRNCC